MHGTRTTAKILVGAAVAALAGCAPADARPPARVPSPAAESSVLPAQEVAPQIVEGPAREALEAALPAPPPSAVPPPSAAPRATPVPAAAPEQHRRTAVTPQPPAPRPAATPRHHETPRPAPRPAVPDLPGLADLPKEPPQSRADVCDLGERYGGWDPHSDQARICHGTYGR
ncbi:Lipoprotein [Streptomyces venezuelae]|uniref:hypothetical protein n=1 Tax=Streptomyces gardneri TaxID=66892 RepID=UPI0006BDF489|nr:hypothetical protein [Streptomyces gardneri]ALO06904.1 Lipoprotein [Streptomyces venezuelae]QPK44281.1 hypothetical protein H4W23_06435 [Streptomyces gardneri]WRK35570.1 hypothetical protein U0M97_06470 [Streptomyces venezuelae]CUM42800.1 FIG01135370: hypothetical protein [Streptomyces venezuelae]